MSPSKGFVLHHAGPYFSAVDLAEIARGLDEAERQRMAEGDTNSPEYLNFIQVISIASFKGVGYSDSNLITLGLDNHSLCVSGKCWFNF